MGNRLKRRKEKTTISVSKFEKLSDLRDTNLTMKMMDKKRCKNANVFRQR